MQTAKIICLKNIWAYKKRSIGSIQKLHNKELDPVCTTVILLTFLNKKQDQQSMQAYSKQKFYKILTGKY
jgi:hypothetical protein